MSGLPAGSTETARELNNRMAWRRPRCLDQILASEWGDVMVTFLRAGGYNPDRTQWMELGEP